MLIFDNAVAHLTRSAAETAGAAPIFGGCAHFARRRGYS